MRSVPNKIAAIAATLALVASSTVSAAAPAPQAQPAQVATPDAWIVLTSLSAAQTPGLAGASAATAQQSDVPPPPPLAPAAGGMSGGAGELIPFALWAGLIALALTIGGPSGAGSSASRPNSAG